MTIYIDVLIILNIYVNYFLLRITAKLTGSPLKPFRCIAASLYGSLFSLLILAPKLPIAINLIIKLAAAVTVVTAAFGVHGKVRLIKNTAAFFGANFITAGAIYAAYSWLKPNFMHFSNSYFYIDFSLLLLIVATAVLYFIVSLLRRMYDKTPIDGFSVIIRLKDRIFRIDGLADTGNSLTDFFSGKPVIICSQNDIGNIPKDVRIRLIPLSTVTGSSLMKLFSPDEILIINKTSGERKPVNAVIGLGEAHGKAIFNPKILNN